MNSIDEGSSMINMNRRKDNSVLKDARLGKSSSHWISFINEKRYEYGFMLNLTLNWWDVISIFIS